MFVKGFGPVLYGQGIDKFDILSQTVASVWVGVPQVAMLRTSHSMTLAGQDIEPLTLTFTRVSVKISA